MSSLCEFVNRNVAKIRLLEKIERHPKFPPAHRGDNLLRYIFTVAVVFHVYMVLSGWVGVWSFFTRCPSLQLYEKLVLIVLRLAVMAIHCVAAACFVLNVLGGAPVPPCERICHLYHQFMVLYRSVALPASMLVMIGSLLSFNLEQFALLLLHVPIEAVGLLWHVIICDAFLRGQPLTDGEASASPARDASSKGSSPANNRAAPSGKQHNANSAGWAKAPPSPGKAALGKNVAGSSKQDSKERSSTDTAAVPPTRGAPPPAPPAAQTTGPIKATATSKSSKKSEAESSKNKAIDD